MRDLNLFSSSALSTLVRVVALATLTLLSLAIGSLLLKTSRWRTWLRDLPGPQRKSWFLGNWADFGVSRRAGLPALGCIRH